jgi:hypothetical protein
MSESTFIMNDGKISNNETNDSFGAGVWMYSNSEFIMNGGEISNNSSPASSNGGRRTMYTE